MNKLIKGYIAMGLMVVTTVAAAGVVSYEFGQPSDRGVANQSAYENGADKKGSGKKALDKKKGARTKKSAIKTKKAKRPKAAKGSISTTAVGHVITADVDMSRLKDGTYLGSAVGFNGPVSVRVTINNGRIVDLSVISQNETPEYYARAKAVLGKMLSAQSTNVDSVSGATITSNALKLAVSRALQEAVSYESKVDTESVSATNTYEGDKFAENSGRILPPNLAKEVEGPKADALLKDGVYRGEASGFNSIRDIVLDVEVRGGKLVAIKVISFGEDLPYWNKAVDIIKKLVAATDIEKVDTVSGATYSSRGIKNAVKKALKKAADAKLQDVLDKQLTKGIVVTAVDDKNYKEVFTSRQIETLETLKHNSKGNIQCFILKNNGKTKPENFKYKVPIDNENIALISTLKVDGTQDTLPKDAFSIREDADGKKWLELMTKELNPVIVQYDSEASRGDGNAGGENTQTDYVSQIVGNYDNPLFVRPPALDSTLHDGYYIGHGKGYYAGFTNSYVRQTKVGINVENGKITRVDDIDFGDDRTGGGPGFKFKSKKFMERAFNLVKNDPNQFIKNHLDFERYITGRWIGDYDVPGITYFPQDKAEDIKTTLKAKVEAMDGLTGATMSNSGYSRAIAEALYKASKGEKQINDMYLEDHDFERVLSLELPDNSFGYNHLTYFALSPEDRRRFRAERGYGKELYYVGEGFDPSGFVLTVKYTDGTQESLPFDKLEEKGFRARLWYQDTKGFEPVQVGSPIRKIPYNIFLYVDRPGEDPNIKSNYVNRKIFVVSKNS